MGKRTIIVIFALLAFTIAACSSGAKPAKTSAAAPSTSAAVTTSAAPSTSASPTAAATPVHIKSYNGDGATYGVGIPIVLYFSKLITDSSAFIKATTVTVNGANAGGAWYFENSGIDPTNYPLEAHYRPQNYWPADSTVHMNMPVDGLSGGPGFVFDDNLTLTFSIGDSHVSTVDCTAERMMVTSNGVAAHAPMLTSCGAPKTPTATGTKVVLQLGEDLPGTNTLRPQGAVRMIGSNGAHYDLIVPWSVRVTQGGEYVHAAAWNGKNIGQRSTSDGCTNLNTPDAEWFYNFSRIGDIVNYVNTGGPPMQVWDGFGDWNVAWSTWQAGGVVQASS
jgi:lipoprotein-anchoring transpeptidase ErfK/SrfK